MSFKENLDYAEISYTQQNDKKIQYKIGLTNKYQITKIGEHAYAAKGEWIAPDTFTISYEQIGYSSKGKWVFIFDKDTIQVK